MRSVSANGAGSSLNEWKELLIKNFVMVKFLMSDRKVHQRNGYNSLSLKVTSTQMQRCEHFMHDQ